MRETTAASPTLHGELPLPERPESASPTEPEASLRDYALEQLGAVLASGLEE